jgi:NADH-quinone oxidoreductase subunit E
VSEHQDFPRDPASGEAGQGDSRTTVDPALAHGPLTGVADPLRGSMQSTDLLTAAERKELIAGMTPDDAQRVPELHEVDIPDELKAQIEEAMSRYPQVRSASIPALWAIQRRYGWCTPEGIVQAAAVMGLSPAYLQSVASFYDLFRTVPTGPHRVLVCTNISCWMNGADELLESFCEASGCEHEAAAHGGADSPDGEMLVSGFECLGACDIAPMVSVDGIYYGPLEPGDAATIVEQIRSGAEVMPEKDIRKRPVAGGPETESDPRVTNAPARKGDDPRGLEVPAAAQRDAEDHAEANPVEDSGSDDDPKKDTRDEAREHEDTDADGANDGD